MNYDIQFALQLVLPFLHTYTSNFRLFTDSTEDRAPPLPEVAVDCSASMHDMFIFILANLIHLSFSLFD
jgi:hypothetical protein